MSRRYIATLAIVAIVILGMGLLVRSRLYSEPVETAPPSEAATLRQLSQEGQLRRSAAFVATQVAAMAANVEYVRATGASGLWWTSDTLLSSARGRAVVAIAPAASPEGLGQARDSVGRAPAISTDSAYRGWVVVVGKDADGHVISAQFLTGGRTATECAGAPVQRYVLGPSLDSRLAGAGVFGLDGAVLGLAVWCDGEIVAVPAHEVRRLLAERQASVIESALGFTVAPASPVVRAVVDSDSALLVTFVRAGSVADEAGLEAGDVVLAIDGRPAADAAERLARGPDAPTDSLVLTLRRERGVSTIGLARTDAAGRRPLGVELATSAAPAGVPVARIESGSAAARAGLRAGDRLVRVGSTAVTSTATAGRLLATAGRDGRPTLLVVAREDGEHALLVPAPPGAPDSASARR